MDDSRTALLERLERRLRTDAQNGGWPYYTGKTPRIEPTCWALLSLGSSWNPASGSWAEFAAPHCAFLSDRAGSDGLLSESEPGLANYTTNGLALIVMSRFASLFQSETIVKLHAGVVAAKGVRVDLVDEMQDSRLQGWSWIRDTFSWVEPTAWCLLALKKADDALRNAASAAREAEAEKLLINRVCTTGGWNYGNSSALGQDLRAYVPTTAVGLLSMPDRRNDPAVQRSIRFLTSEQLSEPSAMALSLAAICLRVYGLRADDVEHLLETAVLKSEESANLQTIATTLYALSGEQHMFEAIRVRS